MLAEVVTYGFLYATLVGKKTVVNKSCTAFSSFFKIRTVAKIHEGVSSMSDLENIDLVSSVGTASLHEAAGKIGALASAIKPLSPSFRLFGPAFPVQSSPADNLWLHRAIYEATEGDILVVNVSDYYEAGYWGEVMSHAAIAKKLGGLVIDGGIRDSQSLIELGFPVFAHTICIQGTSKNPNLAGSLKMPVRIGEVIVNYGDLVAGDADGVVVIPRAIAEEIVEKAKVREEAEAQIFKRLAEGESTLEIYNLPR